VPDVYISRWRSSPARRADRGRGQVDEPVPAADPLADGDPNRCRPEAADGVVGQVEQLVVGDDGPSLRVLEDVGDLGGGEPPVDRHGDGAQVVGGVDGGEEVGAVVGEQRPHVAGPDAPFLEAAGHRGGPVDHGAVGDDVVAVDRQGLLGHPPRVVLQDAEPAQIRVHETTWRRWNLHEPSTRWSVSR
jgi:hypothetical protein